MSLNTETLKTAFADFVKENDKFTAGNQASAARARKALMEMIVCAKARRLEISQEKADIAEAKLK